MCQPQIIQTLRFPDLVPRLHLDRQTPLIRVDGLSDVAHFHKSVPEVLVTNGDAVVVLQTLKNLERALELGVGVVEIAQRQVLQPDAHAAARLTVHVVDLALDYQALFVVLHRLERPAHFTADARRLSAMSPFPTCVCVCARARSRVRARVRVRACVCVRVCVCARSGHAWCVKTCRHCPGDPGRLPCRSSPPRPLAAADQTWSAHPPSAAPTSGCRPL